GGGTGGGRGGVRRARAAASPPLLLRRLVWAAGVRRGVGLLAQRLAAEHAALPVRRAAPGGAARGLGRLALRGEIGGDPCGVFDDREQASCAPGRGDSGARPRRSYAPKAPPTGDRRLCVRAGPARPA